MTRNLVICVVPTVIAILAVYWFRKKKRIKPNEESVDSTKIKEQESPVDLSAECTSDFANTLSDASSFTSPVSSEKSLRTSSSLYTSPLHDITAENHIHRIETLSNCINENYSADLSFAKKDKDFYELNDLHSDISKVQVSSSKQLESSNSNWNSLEFENVKEDAKKINAVPQLVSDNNVDFYKTNDIYLSNSKKNNDSLVNENDNCLKINNCSDHKDWNNLEVMDQQNILAEDNNCDFIENSMFSHPKKCEKVVEIDSHSSVFDENSLSYVSDDSEYKHLTECKNKDSLSSVLDENSLLSSFCEEIEKSTDSSSPAVGAKPEQFDSDSSESHKDIHNFMPLKDLTLLLDATEDVNMEDKSSEVISDHFNCSNIVKNDYLNDELLNKIDLITSAVNSETVAEYVLNNFSDFKSISSSVCVSDENTSNLSSSDKTVSQSTTGDTVQNLLPNLHMLVSSPIKKDSTCDSVDSEINVNCSPQDKSGSLSESVTSMSDPDSADSKPDLDSSGQDASVEKTETNLVDTDVTTLIPDDASSNDKTANHLEAAADVVQRISSDLSTSFSDLLRKNQTWDSPNLKSNLKWCPSWSKNESPSESKTSIPVRVCDIKDDSLPSEKSEHLEESKVVQSSEVLKTESPNDDVNTKNENQNLSVSSSLEANENHIEALDQVKKEINGISDIKVPSQSLSEYVYEFELPQELCGRLIGKHGKHVKSIMERSNANVFIKRHPYDPLLKVVVVEGHRSDVNEALEIIRRKYPPSQFPTVTLVQTNALSAGVPMPESLQWSRLYFSYLLPSPCSYIFNSSVVNFAELMSICVTQLHLPEGASCDVILSSLVSAGHFFLQQPTHPTYPSLSTLDQCMISLYSQMDTPLLPQPIEAGVICAAPVYRGWYRAQVIYVCENTTDCGIKFVDYGGFSQVTISSLRQIRSDFMSLPFQASECYLAHVRPVGNEGWSTEATSVFEELAQGQILQALLIEYADDGIPCVYLYRVQGVSSTFINKELVERGLAVWINGNHWDPH